MNLRGSITAEPDPPGIDLDEWTHLTATHPNLRRIDPKQGVNPFTRTPLTYDAHPGTARVICCGDEVGMMHAAEDGSHQIVVWGDGGIVDRVAADVAAQLGGRYERFEP